ncbi:ABC transporter permease [Vibrio fluvialis]|nr:ABC transporter permease [Vibrio fluvialis]MBY8086906.1 ABC transporter permease [Vibrio fluvialis]MBY8103959.1 ABC transporter permease [Vibrio fluvialis]
MLKNKRLIYELAKRDIMIRYSGSFMGVFWSFLTPLFMLAVYTLVFGKIFNARWNGAVTDSMSEFALNLFLGLLIFNLFSECLTRAPGLILHNANYVKKVIFPLEVLPITAFIGALFHFIIGIFVWEVAYLFIYGSLNINVVYAIVIMLPFSVLVLGLSYFLCALGVYIRDIGQVIGIGITALMFLSPIFYPLSTLPKEYHNIARINPITVPVEEIRGKLMYMQDFNLGLLAIYSMLSCIVLVIGFQFFRKLRPGFADVI